MELGYSVKTDALGNIYTTGNFQLTVDFDPSINITNLTSVNSSLDIFICKFDPNGNFIWAKSIGGANYDYCKEINVDENGNVFATGFFQGTADFDPSPSIFNLTSSGSSDIFITKLDSSGNFLWANKIGGTGDDRGQSLKTDKSGNIIISGAFSSTVDFDPGISVNNLVSSGLQDIFIGKYDKNGSFILLLRMII
jgi:hypothetical protein